ncbi:MAG: 1-acyl-sn-glycerol-3-phosphate acyltransferase [Verrucomicrobiae bacterium]|nr:1-acyl-sn-glycerol-3-phosphate acyltransferase [Verrucomicrobiae bacterium]MCP5541339.1 1-acyl-sn-glycerol-3-phosphate acyltransferase [Akkermansiaceae bacterium]
MHPAYRVGKLISNLLANLYFRRRIVNPEKLKLPGGCLVVANHASFLDPPMIGSAFPGDIHYMARRTLFREGIVEWVYRRLNAVPVNQDNPELSTIKRILQLVKDGEKVLIFPEGERTWDGELKARGAPGIGLLIAKSKAPILPVRLFGAFEALPRGHSFPKPAKLTLVAGDPIDFTDFIAESGLAGKDLYQALSDRAMEAIAALEIPDPSR